MRNIKEPEKVKPDKSTFFPDSWSLQDIWNAIETAATAGKKLPNLEVTTTKGKGMRLWENPDSYFPDYEGAG